jgi:hypothetical protein
MTDFRNLQYYLSQLHVTPTAEEYHLEGYSLLRQCSTEAQTILKTPFAASGRAPKGDPDRCKQQLRAYGLPILLYVDFENRVTVLKPFLLAKWTEARDERQ